MPKISQMYRLLLNAADEIIANLGKYYETLSLERKEFFSYRNVQYDGQVLYFFA